MTNLLYNIALSIGNHTDLRRMLNESIESYLLELRCDAGFVCASQPYHGGSWQMEIIHACSKDTPKEAVQSIAEQLRPNGEDPDSLAAFYRAAPAVEKHGAYHAMVMPLRDFGALILIRKADAVGDRTLSSLSDVNLKLARACLNLRQIRSSGQDSSATSPKNLPLLREKAYLDQLFDNAQVGIIMAENDGTVIRINPEFQRIFGFSYEDAIGRNIDELVAAEADLKDAAHITHSVSKGNKHLFEAQRRSKDGSVKHVAIMASPIVLSGAQVAVYAFYQDITHERQMEAELLKAKKLEATGKLAGGIAHDFNNLLAIIMGNIDIALLKVADQKLPDTMHLKHVRKVCARAHELTQKFITFSAGGLLMKQDVDLKEILHQLSQKVFNDTAVEVSFDMAADLWAVEADVKQLRHALAEILTNAAESNSNGGRVRIVSANVRNCIDETNSTSANHRPCVQLIIEDDGVGIPAEVLPQIFDPYYSSKQLSNKTGLGLGLTIAHSIVTKHGGSIRVESDQGRGTRVVVSLPVAYQSPDA